MSEAPKPHLMSGMRTTGSLHLGNYFGALKNWIDLQDQYTCFFGAMDWHAMTDAYKQSGQMHQNTQIMIAEWIATGIDPEKSILFVQSKVPQHLELFMILANLTPMGWLERVPTWKEVIGELQSQDAYNLGRFAYPVLQAVDIALYKGKFVPVGKDQLVHIELVREIIRRFNRIYQTNILIEPQALLTTMPLLVGTDGTKMSKSKNNVFPLLAEKPQIIKCCNKMLTDPQRARRQDPGRPEVCSVFEYHKLFSLQEDIAWAEQGCRTAGIGCGDCKAKLAENIHRQTQEPLEKKKQLLAKPKVLNQIIDEGCFRAREMAKKTLQQVRQAMSLS